MDAETSATNESEELEKIQDVLRKLAQLNAEGYLYQTSSFWPAFSRRLSRFRWKILWFALRVRYRDIDQWSELPTDYPSDLGFSTTALVALVAVMVILSTPALLTKRRPRRVEVTSRRLAGLAVLIAGRKRSAVADEWRSHLSGETGSGLPEDRQVREAAGFVIAAVSYRLQDAADFAWRPVDAVLASRKLSNLVVFSATLMIAVFYVHHGGLNGLADNLEGVGVTWGAAFGLIHVGRQWRDIKPPERKPRRTKE